MEHVFESTKPFKTERSSILVVHCSDPRFQAHFKEFLTQHLKLEDYIPLTIPGGVSALTLVDEMPKFFHVMNKWLSFFKDSVKQVVLISHEDCMWYKELKIKGVKIFYLGCNPRCILGSIKFSDEVYSTLPIQKSFPALLSSHPERSAQPDSCNNNSPQG